MLVYLRGLAEVVFPDLVRQSLSLEDLGGGTAQAIATVTCALCSVSRSCSSASAPGCRHRWWRSRRAPPTAPAFRRATLCTLYQALELILEDVRVAEEERTAETVDDDAGQRHRLVHTLLDVEAVTTIQWRQHGRRRTGPPPHRVDDREQEGDDDRLQRAEHQHTQLAHAGDRELAAVQAAQLLDPDRLSTALATMPPNAALGSSASRPEKTTSTSATTPVPTRLGTCCGRRPDPAPPSATLSSRSSRMPDPTGRD